MTTGQRITPEAELWALWVGPSQAALRYHRRVDYDKMIPLFVHIDMDAITNWDFNDPRYGQHYYD